MTTSFQPPIRSGQKFRNTNYYTPDAEFNRMSEVELGEALRYGFSFLAYITVTGFIAAFMIFLGLGLIAEGERNGTFFVGVIVSALGYLVAIAATYGALYKLIADAVGRGNGHIQGPLTKHQQILQRLNQ